MPWRHGEDGGIGGEDGGVGFPKGIQLEVTMTQELKEELYGIMANKNDRNVIIEWLQPIVYNTIIDWVDVR